MANSADFKVKNNIDAPYIKEFGGSKNPVTKGPSIAFADSSRFLRTSSMVDNSDFTLRGAKWKDDGTALIVCAQYNTNSSRYLYTYSCSTAFDLSTATNNGFEYLGTADYHDVDIDPSGVYAVTVDNTYDRLRYYTLDTPWEIATDDTNGFFNTTNELLGSPAGVSYNHDGTRLYVINRSSETNGRRLVSYTLSTPYDVSTATHEETTFLPSVFTGFGLYVAHEAKKLYVNNYSYGTLHEFHNPTGKVSDLVQITQKRLAGGSDPVVTGYTFQNGLTFRPDDHSTLYLLTSNDTVHELDTSVSTLEVDFSKNSVVEFELTDDSEMTIHNASDDGTLSQATVAVTGALINPYTFDYSDMTASIKQVTLYSLLGISSMYNSTTFFFSTDGSKLYVGVLQTNTVYEIDLATPWQIDTATYNSVSLSVTSEIGTFNTIKDINFKSNGSVMYVTEQNGVMYHYNLTTPWDLSTASYGSKSFDFESYITFANPGQIHGFRWRPDGSEIWFTFHNASTGGGQISYIRFNTAWDISSGVDVWQYTPLNTTSSSASYWQGFDISTNGEHIALAFTTHGIKKGDLSTAWNFNSQSSSFPSYPWGNATSVRFSEDGEYLYSVHLVSIVYTLQQVQTSEAASLAIASGSTLDGQTTVAPDPLKTNVYSVSTSDGGKTHKVSSLITGAS